MARRGGVYLICPCRLFHRKLEFSVQALHTNGQQARWRRQYPSPPSLSEAGFGTSPLWPTSSRMLRWGCCGGDTGTNWASSSAVVPMLRGSNFLFLLLWLFKNNASQSRWGKLQAPGRKRLAGPSWCTMAGRHCYGFSGTWAAWYNAAKEIQQGCTANPYTICELCVKGQVKLDTSSAALWKCLICWLSANEPCGTFMHKAHWPLSNNHYTYVFVLFLPSHVLILNYYAYYQEKTCHGYPSNFVWVKSGASSAPEHR